MGGAARRRWRWLLPVVGGVIVALSVCVASWMLTEPLAIADPRERAEATRGTQFALLCYMDSLGHYPPPLCRNPWGRPLSSWRLNLRGWTEQNSQLPPERADLPWYAPENLRWLLDGFSRMYVFTMPHRSAPGKLRPNLVALVGPGTAFGDGTSAPSHVPADTIVLIVTASLDIHWTQSGDLDVRDVSPCVVEGIDGLGVHVAFADGEVWYLDRDVPLAVLQQFFTVARASTRDREADLSPHCKKRVAFRDAHMAGTALLTLLPGLRPSPRAPSDLFPPPALDHGLLASDAVSPWPRRLSMQQLDPEQQEGRAEQGQVQYCSARDLLAAIFARLG